MSKFLRGNFETQANLESGNKEESLEDRFERAALARLGGSIGYVSRKKFIWNGEHDGEPKAMSEEGRAAQYDNSRQSK